ncbi:hypothetical protein JCM10207_003282 [Rhodosporidiobolus poonsookiae]
MTSRLDPSRVVSRTAVTTTSGRFRTVYSSSGPIDPKKPTLALINSFATSVDLYATELNDQDLCAAFNLVAVGLLGHEEEAQMLDRADSYTFYDQADLIIDVMETLGVEQYYLLGTSQGGFIAMRAAVRAPKRVLGVIGAGTGFRGEGQFNQFFRDILTELHGAKEGVHPPKAFLDWLIPLGWGDDAPKEVQDFWRQSCIERYSGAAGGRRLFGALTELLERDPMDARLLDFQCPLWVIHGERDVGLLWQEVKTDFDMRVPDCLDKRWELVPGGAHFLTQSRFEACKKVILEAHAAWVK